MVLCCSVLVYIVGYCIMLNTNTESLGVFWLVRYSLLMLISNLCRGTPTLVHYKYVLLFLSSQIAVPVSIHVLSFSFLMWYWPMITPKHDKHISETFMWITPNLLYEALCICIFSPTPICQFFLACNANWAFKLFAPLLLSSICYLCWCNLQVVRLDDDQLHSSNDYICNDYDYAELSFAPNWQPFDQLVLSSNLGEFLFTTMSREHTLIWLCLSYFLFLRWEFCNSLPGTWVSCTQVT